jgi:hypothetical protein
MSSSVWTSWLGQRRQFGHLVRNVAARPSPHLEAVRLEWPPVPASRPPSAPPASRRARRRGRALLASMGGVSDRAADRSRRIAALTPAVAYQA